MKDYWLLQKEENGEKTVEHKTLLPGRNLPSRGSWAWWWKRTQRGLETRNKNKKEEKTVSFHLPWAHWVWWALSPSGNCSGEPLPWGLARLTGGPQSRLLALPWGAGQHQERCCCCQNTPQLMWKITRGTAPKSQGICSDFPNTSLMSLTIPAGSSD